MAVLHTRTKTTTKAVQREIAGQMKDMPLEWLLALRDDAVLLHKHPGTLNPQGRRLSEPADNSRRNSRPA